MDTGDQTTRRHEAQALQALNRAILRRQTAPGLIHHSDQGSQYSDQAYHALLRERGIQAGMNGVVNADGDSISGQPGRPIGGNGL
jgi:transposase InsO family protein